jgi:ribosome biogenesis protein BMS1
MYLAAVVAAVDPDTIYDGGYTVSNARLLLRIGNGVAGQSGLIEGSLP